MGELLKKMMGIPTKYTEEEYINVYRKLRKSNVSSIPSANRIEFIIFASDDEVFDIADKIGIGIPIVINFSNIGVDQANKAITFLTGCLYPLGGKVIEVKSKIYLFASEENLKDGTLKGFVEEYR